MDELIKKVEASDLLEHPAGSDAGFDDKGRKLVWSDKKTRGQQNKILEASYKKRKQAPTSPIQSPLKKIIEEEQAVADEVEKVLVEEAIKQPDFANVEQALENVSNLEQAEVVVEAFNNNAEQPLVVEETTPEMTPLNINETLSEPIDITANSTNESPVDSASDEKKKSLDTTMSDTTGDNLSGLPTVPVYSRFHPLALAMAFKSAERPDWDTGLIQSIKEQNTDISLKYRMMEKCLPFLEIVPALITNLNSKNSDIEEEFIEIMQLYFAKGRTWKLGQRTDSYGIPLSSFLSQMGLNNANDTNTDIRMQPIGQVPVAPSSVIPTNIAPPDSKLSILYKKAVDPDVSLNIQDKAPIERPIVLNHDLENEVISFSARMDFSSDF